MHLEILATNTMANMKAVMKSFSHNTNCLNMV